MNKLKMASAIALVSASMQVAALPITLEVVGADWSNVVGGANVQYINADGVAGNEEIRWGGRYQTKSGYNFDSVAPPATVVETDTTFSLGTLTHFNNPITAGTAISGAQLNISAQLSIGGVALTEGPFNFSFMHDETSNSCSPSPSCANDLVSFSNMSTSDTFFVNGQEYTLNLMGFFQNGALTDTFNSPEGQSNAAQLLASFSAPIASVPEPGSLALLGLGLVGFAARRRAAK